MRTFGLLGRTLSHSFSKGYFTNKFEKLGIANAQYINIEIESIDHFPEVIKKINPVGFNVTIPYKEQIIPFLDELDETAKEIGAVNTVKVHNSGDQLKLSGYNTDAFGFHQSIKPFVKSHHERALILGTGGASKAVAHVLKQYGIDFLYVTRTKTQENQISWEEMNENVVKHHRLIINTTPLGMYPNSNNKPPVAYEAITKDHLLVDLIYNPEETLFMAEGRSRGAVALNGLTMLHQQAEEAWRIWNS